MVRLLAVDGTGIGHRAYHARRHEAQPGPFVTGAVVRMLATTWRHGPYDALLVAFDHRDNRRKDLYPEYKSHRPETAPQLREQLDQLVVNLTECGVPVACVDGAEADDVLATVADRCDAAGHRCDVLSSDRDLLALVGPTTRLLRPRATMSDLRVYDPATVRAEYGIEPAQYTDLAALRGDPSDGLEGVHGVGPKTAARLLRDHGSVPAIYAALTDLEPKVEAALRAARAQVERNLLLMAPLPRLELDLDGVVSRGVDADRVARILTDLGLPADGQRFRSAVSAPALPPLPPPPVEEPASFVPAGAGVSRARGPAPHAGEQAALF